jgi:molecular chaperone GrpE
LVEENKVTPENERPEAAKAENDIEILKRNLADEKEKSNKYLANWQRAEADFSNYKKRTDQEKSDMTAFANWALILNLLPIVDDMERAIASLPPKLANLTWVDGVLLIHRKLKAIFESQGLTEIETTGKPFDPSIHEAVAHIEGEEGMVLNEAQKGYKLKNKVLRPALVVVGKGKMGKSEGGGEEVKPNDTTGS